MTSEKDFRIEGDKLIRYLGDASNVKIPEGVRMIGEGAFKDDTTLISVTIPEGCEGIEEGAFQWCSALEIVHAPDLIMAVGLNAFAGTRFDQYYSENETSWNEDFCFLGKVLYKGRRSLREARIPEGTVRITADAFREHVLLRKISIPSTCVEIGWRAFESCTGLTEVTVPGNAKILGWHAFRGCSRLADRYLQDAKSWQMQKDIS